VIFYRSMRPAEDGKPVVAKSRWGLGVRTEGLKPDIVVTDGKVRPRGGGLSVANDWNELPASMRPTYLGGSNKREKMYSLVETALPDGLKIRQEGPKWHYMVEPVKAMPIEEYEDLLKGTREKWEQVEE
jgi:hypothetical protein